MRIPSRTRMNVTFLGSVALVCAHMAVLTWAVYRPRTPVEDKLLLADRVMYYAMDADRGPLFALSGKERELRVVTHVLLGEHHRYDPRQEIVYGVRLRVRAPSGKEIFTRDLWTSARVSKAGLDGRLWRSENAFAVSGDLLITDARSERVELPPDLPMDAVLDAKLLGGARHGVIKLYQVDPTTAAAASLAAKTSTQIAAALDRVTFTPADDLSAAERIALVAREQKRIPAGGERDREYVVRQIFTTRYRAGVPELEANVGLVVDPLRAVAVNVRGPASLGIFAWRSPLDGPPRPGGTIHVRAIPAASPHAAPLGWDFPAPANAAPEEHRLSLPGGLFTLEVRADVETPARVRITSPEESRIAGFGTPSFPVPEGQVVMPEEQTVEALVASADGPPVELETAGRDLHAMSFRVDAWVALSDTAVVSSASIFAEAFDAKGRKVDHEELFVASARAPFDRAFLSSGEESGVSERLTLRLVVPPGSRTVRLRASRDVAVRIFAQRPRAAEDDRLDPPFDAPLLDGVLWKYAPRRSSEWIPVVPTNAAALFEAGKRVAISGAVRIAPGEAAPAPTPIDPIAETEKQKLVDRERGDRTSEIVAGWGPGLATALDAGKAARIDFGRRGSIAEIEYIAGPRDVGKRVDVVLDERSAGAFTIDGANGTWRVPTVDAGVHTLRVATSSKARLFVDQPPAAPAALLASAGAGPLPIPTPVPVWRIHTVHKVPPGGDPLVLRVDKIGETPETIDLVVYAPGNTPNPHPSVRVALDRGAKRTREISFGLPAPELVGPGTLPAYDGRAAGYARLLPFTLGADVPPGPHTLDVSNLGNDVVWVRASIAPSGPADPFAHLARGDAAAFTIDGPASVAVRVRRESSSPHAPATGTLTIREIDARFVAAKSHLLALPAGDSGAALPIPLGPGVHSLLVSSDSAETWNVEITGAAGSAVPFGARPPIPVAEGDAVPPDVRRTQVFVASKEGPAIEFDPGSTQSSALRVDAWAIGPATATGTIAASLLAEVDDAGGRPLSVDELLIASPPSPFDRAFLADGSGGRVTEPVTFRLVRPAGGRRLKLRATASVAVKVYAEPDVPPTLDLLESPWRDITLFGTTWRNAPHEARAWIALLPANQRTLIDRGRWASLVTEVRLEPKAPPVLARILDPTVESEQQTALEPVPVDRAALAISAWEPGAKTALPRNVACAFDFGRAGPGRPEIAWSSALADLGRKVEVDVDGRPAGLWTLGTTRGSWSIAPLTAGRHVVEVQTEARSLSTFFDQAPLFGSAQIFKARTVHLLDGRGRLVFKVEKLNRLPLTLDVVLYAPRLAPNPAPGLRVRVDGGAARTYSLPTADIPDPARLSSLKDRAAGYPRLYPVVLGSEVPPGTHAVEIASVQPTQVWVRAFVVDPSAPAQEKARQGYLMEPVSAYGPSDE